MTWWWSCRRRHTQAWSQRSDRPLPHLRLPGGDTEVETPHGVRRPAGSAHLVPAGQWCARPPSLGRCKGVLARASIDSNIVRIPVFRQPCHVPHGLGWAAYFCAPSRWVTGISPAPRWRPPQRRFGSARQTVPPTRSLHWRGQCRRVFEDSVACACEPTAPDAAAKRFR